MKRSKETWIISKVKYYWAFCNKTTRGLSAILKNIYIAHEHQRSHDAFDVISLSQSAVFPPCRSWPEPSILGADQKDRGLWGRDWVGLKIVSKSRRQFTSVDSSIVKGPIRLRDSRGQNLAADTNSCERLYQSLF